MIMVSQKSITQLHFTTPEQLTENILKGVQSKFNELKKELDSSTQEKYLTRLQTAKMLSISLTCLNDWSKKGILKPLKMGNRTYFKLSDIEEKLDNSNKR
jgi:Helix-turn-helix domain